MVGPYLAADETLAPDPANRGQMLLTIPVILSTATGRTRLIARGQQTTQRDPVLIAALKRAHGLVARDAHGPRLDAAPASQYARRLAALACLAPDLQQAILTGRQPAHLTLDSLITIDLPPLWSDQRKLVRWTA
jgi:hypothetical protein